MFTRGPAPAAVTVLLAACIGWISNPARAEPGSPNNSDSGDSSQQHVHQQVPQQIHKARAAAAVRARTSRADSASWTRQPEIPTRERTLKRTLESLWSARPLRQGTTAVYVADADTGEPLFAVHENEPLNPASNVKLISTAAALEILGPDWRYTTRVLGPMPTSAPNRDPNRDANSNQHAAELGALDETAGVVDGDIFLLGNYDPTLGKRDLDRLAAAMAESGITHINGDLYIGEEDLRDSLASPRIKVEVIGTKRGRDARVVVSPELPFIDVVADVTTVKRRRRSRARLRASVELIEEVIDPMAEVRAATYGEDDGEYDGDGDYLVAADSETSAETGEATYGDPTAPRLTRRWRVTVSGTVPARRSGRIRPRIAPDNLFTAHVFAAALARHGVAFHGEIRQTNMLRYLGTGFAEGGLPVTLARHKSEPISDMVAAINKHSINRLADRVIMTAGMVRYGGLPSMGSGIAAMHEWLRVRAEIDPGKVWLDTGSGLSYSTELTARQIVRVLRVAAGFAIAPAVDLQGAAGEHAADVAAHDDFEIPLTPDVAARDSDAYGGGDDDGADFAYEQEDGHGDGHGFGNRLTRYRMDQNQDMVQQSFVHSLAIGGVDGTLRKRFRDAELRGQIAGKTGTLTRVVALSGIVSHGDASLVFAIVTNGHRNRRRQQVRRQHEEIVEALYEYLRDGAAQP